MENLVISFNSIKHIKIKEKNIRIIDNFLGSLRENRISYIRKNGEKNSFIYIKSEDNEDIGTIQLRNLGTILDRSVSSYKTKFFLGRSIIKEDESL